MAQFPKFVTTGPTIDIPVMPVMRQGFNLMPLIDSLQKQQAMRPAKSAASSGKGTDKDPEIVGTIGQVSQWQRNYDKVNNQIDALMAYYGPDVAVTMPEYRKLVTDKEYFGSQELKNTAKVNKERIDSYDALIKEKQASGLLHLGMLGRTGRAISNGDLSRMQQYAETNMMGSTSENAPEWIKNFEWSPYMIREEDALEEMNSIFDPIGTSETGYSKGWETIKEKLDGNIYGMLQEYNKVFGENKSNYNAFGEGPNSNIKGDQGQLGEAKQEAWKRAAQLFNTEDKLTAGLFQGFLQTTVGITPGAAAGDVGIKEGFMKRSSQKRTKEEEERLEKDHNGYYFKSGDRKGELDAELMMTDARDYAEIVVQKHFEKRKLDKAVTGSDQNFTFNVINDEAYKSIGASKKVETMLQAAREYQTSTATTENQGFTEKNLKDLSGQNDYELGFITELIENPSGVVSSPSTLDVMGSATASGNLSPFTVKIGSNGEKMYVPAETWDGEGLRDKIIADKMANGMNEDNAMEFAQKSMARITNMYNESKSKMATEGGYGFTRTDQTAIHFPAQAVSDDIFDALDETLFSGAKDIEGKPMLRNAEGALFNLDIQVGETVAEGSTFFGPNSMVTGYTGDLSMKAISVAANSGFIVTAPVTIGGQQYNTGQFVHLTKLDGLKPAEVKSLTEGGAIDLGTGFWHKGQDGKYTTKNVRPDMTNPVAMGANSENILTILATTGENAPYAAPQQYYSTYTLETADMEKQIKYWGDKQTTIMVERPQYLENDKGGLRSKYYDKAAEEIKKASSQKISFTHEEKADLLGLKGQLRTEYISELKKINQAPFLTSLTIAESPALDGKYYAAAQGIDVGRWRVSPTLVKQEIVKNGQVTEDARKQLGIVAKGKGASYSVQTNVTGAVLKASGGRALYDGTSDLWLKTRETKHSGKIGSNAENPQGANKGLITGLTPRK